MGGVHFNSVISSGTGTPSLLRVPTLGIVGTAHELAIKAMASYEFPGPAVRTRRGLLEVAVRKSTAPPKRAVGTDSLGERPLKTLRTNVHGLAIVTLDADFGIGHELDNKRGR